MQTPPPLARFGTDGLRGRAGTPPLDPDTLFHVGAALGAWLRARQSTGPGVILGHDGRESASWIRAALARGLAAEGIAAVDLGLVPTPALAHVTRSGAWSAGIMISASHNPARDNGVKIFGSDGFKLADAAEREIEEHVAQATAVVHSDATPARQPELVTGYQEFLTTTFAALDLSGHTIVVDAAHGAGAVLAPAILRQFGARVVANGCDPDGTNINRDVGALHPEHAAALVRAEGALLGVCLDGDGDRGIFIDDSGQVRDGDEVMAVLGRHLHREGRLPHATVVATVMSNLGLHKTLARDGLAVATTPVGDRAVVQSMRDHGYGFGGEQSGHLVFGVDGHYTGDGLFTALRLLSIPSMLTAGSAPLFADFRRFPQLLLNVEVSHKPDLDTLPDVQRAVARVEEQLGSDGRVLLRYSGTENLCRVMVEGPDDAVVVAHAEHIAQAVKTSLS